MHFEIKENILLVNSTEICIPHLQFIVGIGTGANSKVFLAYNKFLRRQEAIKIWIPRQGQVKVDTKRFFEEVKKNANMHFPNVAGFYDANIENGLYYARLEYIPGQTLTEFLRQKQQLVIRYSILKRILETMILVYAAGYYHGDIHTGNVIVKEGEPYIIDFGTSIFSGIVASRKRDCRMLLELSLEVLPELRKLEFLESPKIINQGSEMAAKFLLRCLLIIWDFETSTVSALDSYSYKERRFCFEALIEDFPYIDEELVYRFFKENYSKGSQ